MAKIDLAYTPRLWRCDECGAVIGIVMRNTDRVRRLYVFALAIVGVNDDKELRNYIDLAISEAEQNRVDPILVAPSVLRVRAMDSGEVPCGQCGHVNAWDHSSEALYEALLKMAGRDAAHKFRALMNQS